MHEFFFLLLFPLLLLLFIIIISSSSCSSRRRSIHLSYNKLSQLCVTLILLLFNNYCQRDHMLCTKIMKKLVNYEIMYNIFFPVVE